MKGIKGYITLIILSVVIILIILFLVLRGATHRREQKEKRKLEEEADDLGVNIDNLIADTRKIYDALGIDWFWGIPKPWEDEGIIVEVILAYDRSSFGLLAEAYNNIYRRDLRVDLREYLSESDIAEIAHVIPL